MILKAIIAVCLIGLVALVFTVISPDLLRKLNMVSDAVSHENCRKGLKNQYKMGLPASEFNWDTKPGPANAMDGANSSIFFIMARESIFVDNYPLLATCQNELRAAYICFGVGVPVTDADGSRGF